MKLADLLFGLECKVYGKIQSVEIVGITNNSKTVGPGSLFIAKVGTLVDGNEFSEDAIKNGARAIVSSFHNPFLKVVQIIFEDVYEAESLLSRRYYGDPSKHLYVVGVTGTNGKTTTTYALKQFLDAIGQPAGLVGGIEYNLGNHISLNADNTTPDAISNHKFMREMLKNDCRAAVFEVSSIGLNHKRTVGIDFNAAIFTNLSLDHLDFHGSMETYAYEKNKLFRSLIPERLAIVNDDSSYNNSVLEQCSARKITYGLSSKADVYADNIALSYSKTSFDVHFSGRRHSFETELIGVHNIYNLLVPIVLGIVDFGLALSELVDIIAAIKPPKGRLEPVLNGHCKIFIDYAHTPEGLENILSSLKKIVPAKGRIITVLGCGGDRDKSKRPLMGAIAEKYGIGIITSDNPRSEDPEKIIAEIVVGIKGGEHFIEVDRRTAIGKALMLADKDDIVLIAGKGHESYQKFKHHTIHFDDKEVVEEFLRKGITVV